MNFRQLALNNVKGNWRNYKAFLISSCLSIVVFFMYASFIYHPDVVSGNISMREMISKGLESMNYIVVIFSALFILYANSTFLRARKKEFGLLTLIGGTKSQLGRMIILEQLMLGSIAIVVGIGLGMLCSKLFFQALSVILKIDKTLPLVWNSKAVLITAGVYFILFLILSLFSVWTVGRLQIIDLLREARKQKVEPFAFTSLCVAGIGCIIAAYVLSFQVTFMNFIMLFLPIVGLTIGGTYLLFTQGSTVVLKALQKRKKSFYTYPNMFVLSNLIYKMKDNARFLFVISIITAVVSSAVGTLYVFFEDMSYKTVTSTPHAISYEEKGINTHNVIKEGKTKELIKKHGFEEAREVTYVKLPATQKVTMFNGEHEMPLGIISEKEYNKEARKQNVPEVQNKPGSATMVVIDMMNDIVKPDLTKPFEFTLNGQKQYIKLNDPVSKSVFNDDSYLIVNDEDFVKYSQLTADEEKTKYYGYYIGDWKETENLVLDLKKEIVQEQQQNFHNSILTYKAIKEQGAITMFIGFFVAVLFFFFACSMTYFKWFNDKEQDRIQFKSLKRIGMTDKEIRKIAIRQMGVIFFIPILIGAIHSGFALHTLGKMLYIDLWKSGAIVIGTYVIASAIYFMIAQRGYLKHVKS
ncbi:MULTISPECIES: ABC transporter permease [Bacillus cereus group]|uniref:ABC transporter permease n=1 Tax=Bacillus cereus group TaxID=86661 RepID=UPI000BED9CC0|nr:MULTISPECIES: ABC transporter permease [Bacillus cereus group]MBJ7927945.1 ABC transporter permease [Bacillus cereus group sp. N31]PEG18188.1 ABC transporter permease [Bacillus toyonensis]PEK06287.1 ABC transporter permease [Bacillus toyonensis]PEM14767.1 ABC transporter permease [Bacillus toyonensis]PGA07186.1 ABC transporter permease [Bacillus toyonensis]